jgi:hypothetical protein
MDTVILISQLVIGLGILNVWLLRFGKATSWRGGNAANMREEFEVYGLPGWALAVVGTLKVLLALALIASIWYTGLMRFAAGGLAVLMLGAIAMHLKVRDPLNKSLPAFAVLVLCVVVVSG